MENVAHTFHTFMARTLALEDLSKLGSQVLTMFQQELEVFRRPSVEESSSLFAQVIASAPSDRFKAYMDAGGRHCHTDHAVVVKYIIVTELLKRDIKEKHFDVMYCNESECCVSSFSCEGLAVDNALKGLHTHIDQARSIMDDLHGLVDEANVSMHEDLNVRLGTIDGETSSEVPQRAGSPELVTSPKTKVRQLFSPDYMTTMVVILGMLRQDFVMQERVVSSLSLDVPSEVLSNYCIMWTLRPFVNEAFMKEALSWTRPFRH